MVSIEKIVRPFETRQTASAFAVPSTNEPAKNTVLQYGKSGGSAEVLQSHYSMSVTYYMTKKWNEFMAVGAGGGDPFSSEGIGYEPVHFF